MGIFSRLIKRSLFDPAMYFVDDPQRYVRFKRACLGDYSFGNEETSLVGCSCPDFRKTLLPCWHMYFLALKSGIYDDLFRSDSCADLDRRLSSLSYEAFVRLGVILYYGFCEKGASIKNLKRSKNELANSGLVLISEDGTSFSLSDAVLKNRYFVIWRIMSDERFIYYKQSGMKV